MKELENIINPFVSAICSYHIDDQEFCENLRKDGDELAKAMSQYVLKARIKSLKKMPYFFSEVGFDFWRRGEISQLKKGLTITDDDFCDDCKQYHKGECNNWSERYSRKD